MLDRKTKYLDTATTNFSEGNEESNMKMMKERYGERREMERLLGLLAAGVRVAEIVRYEMSKKSFYIFVFF